MSADGRFTVGFGLWSIGDMKMKRRAVFLDRDGVLNAAVIRGGKPFPPASLAEVTILPGVPEACARLRDAGYLLIVVTNQPDVARGTTSMETVSAINGALAAALWLDEVCVCAHDDVSACQCRKPQPGLLTEAGVRWGIDMALSFMVGDRWRDVEAGRRAGCRCIFVDYGYDERRPEEPDFTTTSLSGAAEIILSASPAIATFSGA